MGKNNNNTINNGLQLGEGLKIWLAVFILIQYFISSFNNEFSAVVVLELSLGDFSIFVIIFAYVMQSVTFSSTYDVIGSDIDQPLIPVFVAICNISFEPY